MRTFVAQTVTIGEQKVSPESESLKFSTTPTPQVQNPSDSDFTVLVCRIHFNGSSATVKLVQFSKDPVLESFWLVAGHLHFDKGLQFCFVADFNIDYIF